MRTITGALCGALALLALPHAQAQMPDAIPQREADLFQRTELTVPADEAFGLACGGTMRSEQAHLFARFDVVDDTGAEIGRGFVAVRWWGETFVSLHTPDGDREVSVTQGSYAGWEAGGLAGHPPLDEEGTMRIAAASWGLDDFLCIVTIGAHDSPGLTWTSLPTERAVYALATDFEGGHAVAANTCAPGVVCASAGAAHQQIYERATDGMATALFIAGAGYVEGSIETPGRDTRRLPDEACFFAVPPNCVDYVTTDTPGTWRYALDKQVTSGAGPILMLLDVPV